MNLKTNMNSLFIFSGAKDLESNSNHNKLMEFYSLDAQIAEWDEIKSYKERFHSFEYTILRVRAKSILNDLGITS